MKRAYVETIGLIERLNRRFLDILRDEFERMQWTDINPTQAMLMFNLGKDEVRAGELRRRSYYLGSNASYNITKLETLGYLQKTTGSEDHRTTKIKLTGKGEEVAEVVDELLDRHLHASGEVTSDLDFQLITALSRDLAALERFWITRTAMEALPQRKPERIPA